MNENRFVKLTASNADDLYDKGLMAKGNLVKYRWAGTMIHYYGLDETDNRWCVGIVSCVHRLGFYQSSLQIVQDEEGLREKDRNIYDLMVYVARGHAEKETICIDTHEIYLAKV